MKFSYHCVARIIGTFATIETAPATSIIPLLAAKSMPEPTDIAAASTPGDLQNRPVAADRTAWRRPAGVSVGTWRYAHEGSIASRYNGFVAGTPLCGIDLELLADLFPPTFASHVGGAPPENARDGDRSRDPLPSKNAPKKKINDSQEWVLDLGCGTGRASEVLAKNGYAVLAIDLSMPMLHQVRERNLDSVVPIQANLVELDALADNIASGAVCLFSTLGMIQGRSNRRQFLSHVRRIVRPGCPFYLHVHHRYAAITSLPGLKQLVGSAARGLMRRDWEFGDAVYAYRGLPDMFLHQFSRGELRGDFAATCWKVQRWERLSLDGAKILGRGSRNVAGGFLVVVD